MPDCQPMDAVEQIRGKALVYQPGVYDLGKPTDHKAGPLRILLAARWEHDKNPEDFFEALKIIKERGMDFRLSVIGEKFREVPDIFEWARRYIAVHIDRWGYQKSRCEYEKALKLADVFVSTTSHEFFGIIVVEACLAGAYPLVPKRLAYPEILRFGEEKAAEQFFYDCTVTDLVDKLTALTQHKKQGRVWNGDPDRLVRLMRRYRWDNLGHVLDQAIAKIVLL